MTEWLHTGAQVLAIVATGAALWRAQDKRLSALELSWGTLVAYLKGSGVVPESLDL